MLAACVLGSGFLLVADATARLVDPNVQIVGLAVAAELFAYSGIAYVGQTQFAASQRAVIKVRSAWVDPWKSRLDAVGSVRRVRITNVGHGPGIVQDVSFELAVPEEPPVRLRSVAALKASLQLCGLKDGYDYIAYNLTEGAVIGPRSPELFIEFLQIFADTFKDLTAVIRYRTALGDVYERRFSLLPYDGAQPPR